METFPHKWQQGHGEQEGVEVAEPGEDPWDSLLCLHHASVMEVSGQECSSLHGCMVILDLSGNWGGARIHGTLRAACSVPLRSFCQAHIACLTCQGKGGV